MHGQRVHLNNFHWYLFRYLRYLGIFIRMINDDHYAIHSERELIIICFRKFTGINYSVINSRDYFLC